MKIGEKKSVNPQKSIRILQTCDSHIAALPFAYCRATIRILFLISFQTGKNGLRRYSERGVFYQIYTLILLIGNSPFISCSKCIRHL